MRLCVICGRDLPEGRATRACHACRRHLRQLLADIHHLWRRLPEALQPLHSGSQKVSGSRISPVPVNLDSIDLAGPARPGSRGPYVRGILGLDEDQLGHLAAATTLHAIAQDWRKQRRRREQPPPVDVPDLIRWLDNRLDDACDNNPQLADTQAELEDLKAALRGTIGDYPPRPERCLGIPCKQCDLLALYRGDPWITCGNCGLLYSTGEYQEWTEQLAGNLKGIAA